MKIVLWIATATSLIGISGLASANPPSAHGHASHGAEARQTAQPARNCPQPMAHSGKSAGVPGDAGKHMSMDEYHRDGMKGGNHMMDDMDNQSCAEMMKKNSGEKLPTTPAPAPPASPKP